MEENVLLQGGTSFFYKRGNVTLHEAGPFAGPRPSFSRAVPSPRVSGFPSSGPALRKAHAGIHGKSPLFRPRAAKGSSPDRRALRDGTAAPRHCGARRGTSGRQEEPEIPRPIPCRFLNADGGHDIFPGTAYPFRPPRGRDADGGAFPAAQSLSVRGRRHEKSPSGDRYGLLCCFEGKAPTCNAAGNAPASPRPRPEWKCAADTRCGNGRAFSS